MNRKKLKVVPGLITSKPKQELKPIPLSASGEPRSEPKFLPPVALSYESTLELKPIPASLSAEDERAKREPGKRRRTKAAAGAKARQRARQLVKGT